MCNSSSKIPNPKLSHSVLAIVIVMATVGVTHLK